MHYLRGESRLRGLSEWAAAPRRLSVSTARATETGRIMRSTGAGRRA